MVLVQSPYKHGIILGPHIDLAQYFYGAVAVGHEHAAVAAVTEKKIVGWDIVGNANSVPVGERVGEVEVGVTNWDVIFGVRGRFAFGSKKALFVPYYLDMGVGDSDFTWQGVTLLVSDIR